MRIYAENTQVMIIDLQEKLLAAMAHKDEVMQKAVMLVKGLKELGIPMLITQQYTRGLGMTDSSILEAAGTEEYFDKRTFSAYKDEATKAEVDRRGRKDVIVCGTEAHVCVLQTCIDLKDAGYRPILVLDAIASRKDDDKAVGIQRAIQEGILVCNAESLLFELLLDSRSPHFRMISDLVK